MEGGIIAAGLGSRFQKAGIDIPKPLIEIGGRPLISWTLAQFEAAGINRIHIIFRKTICQQCVSYLEKSFPRMEFTFICRDTESSSESFLTLLKSWPEDQRVLITTVDSIYRPGMLKKLREFAEQHAQDGIFLGMTSYIDDEKPLYASLGNDMRIVSLGREKSDFVTSGAYLLSSALAKDKDEKGYAALRLFLMETVDSGIPAWGVDLGKVMDVDRPSDLASAEKFAATLT